jgi:hypothetical protein
VRKVSGCVCLLLKVPPVVFLYAKKIIESYPYCIRSKVLMEYQVSTRLVFELGLSTLRKWDSNCDVATFCPSKILVLAVLSSLMYKHL